MEQLEWIQCQKLKICQEKHDAIFKTQQSKALRNLGSLEVATRNFEFKYECILNTR